MAAGFEFKPDERINEVHLAREVGTSRTPLREALNRLVAEGFLTYRTGQGFFCRSLDPESILNLYEARLAVECEGIRLASERAADADIAAVRKFLMEIEPAYHGSAEARVLVELDEEFHMKIIRLSANAELERMLSNLNARSRYVRWIDMEARRGRHACRSPSDCRGARGSRLDKRDGTDERAYHAPTGRGDRGGASRVLPVFTSVTSFRAGPRQTVGRNQQARSD